MSHFTFDNLVTELTKLDTPLQTGPPMKWHRKASTAENVGLSPRKSTCKTPGKTPNLIDMGGATRTPGTAKTTTPGRLLVPVQRNRRKTPSKTPNKVLQPLGQQDRFIPNRAATDVDVAHFSIRKGSEGEEAAGGEYQQQMSDALNGHKDSKILSFQTNKPKPAEGYLNNNKVLYSSKTAKATQSSHPTRIIPQVPEKVLDAPELLDDYYLNVIDWSSNNHVAAALGSSAYIWDATSGSIVQLMALEEPEQYVSSVKWITEGDILAVGTSQGNVELWNVVEQKLVRTMTGHASRVGSLSWNAYICSSGSRSGAIHHHDVRVANHQVATLTNHMQEVCGLSWSPDGRFLASGGNDNVLNVWGAGLGDDVSPMYIFTQHQAAVKALSWCPWQHSVLASGGGTADRQIRLWNINSGSSLHAVDVQSQVCSILWSREYKELISGHGFSQNQLSIWKYPNLTKVADLEGHTERILCLSMSPDETSVASAAADETIRIWKCFATNKPKKSTKSTSKESSTLTLMKSKCIR